MLKIKVILGTTRQQRFGDQPAKWISGKAKTKGLDVEILDLRDYPLPFFDEAMSPTMAATKEAHTPIRSRRSGRRRSAKPTASS